jgi:hypothetical protein
MGSLSALSFSSLSNNSDVPASYTFARCRWRGDLKKGGLGREVVTRAPAILIREDVERRVEMSGTLASKVCVFILMPEYIS